VHHPIVEMWGGGLDLLLNFGMPLVIVNTWFLIVVHPIPSNMVVLFAFLFSHAIPHFLFTLSLNGVDRLVPVAK